MFPGLLILCPMPPLLVQSTAHNLSTKDAAPSLASNGSPVDKDVHRSQVQSLLEKISTDRLTPLPPVLETSLADHGFCALAQRFACAHFDQHPCRVAIDCHRAISNSCNMLPISIAVQENLQVKSLSSIQEGSLLPSDEQIQAGSIPVSKSPRQSNYERKADQTALLSEKPVRRSLLFESPMSIPASAKNEISSPKQFCSSSLQFHHV
ncbi:hypothetical protein O6H91_03G040400 [Diphasiastrum complanatum]|uniref:Uncharacterized protein n=1 Tax=Diphasiastrum complanatum TaxID=34168 RepID=A0ACC2E5C9_DIPCM|nr:hypothetical protein O6H91_Y055900 [Diphasiastrum complanatum]KAJ7561764.1 hypothetical protein O6H91_03G040400 [Diphasiastrum complanatum]